jgi:phosphoribosyl-ATP pyrophosphohydrolase
MDMRDYAAFVDARLGQSQRPLHTLAWMSMLEVAETANEVKRIHTKDGGQLTDERKGAILEEMGDEFYYFVARLNNLGFTLDDVMRANISKLEKRNGRKDYRSFRSGMYGYSPVPDMPDTYNI